VPDPQIGGKHIWELSSSGDKFHQLPNSGDIYMQDVNGANWIVKLNGVNVNLPLQGPLPPYFGPFQPFQPATPYVNFMMENIKIIHFKKKNIDFKILLVLLLAVRQLRTKKEGYLHVRTVFCSFLIIIRNLFK
jgi:hypothetical protein